MVDIAKILVEKLTTEELSVLCEAYDNGELDAEFQETLIPKDCENNPEDYA